MKTISSTIANCGRILGILWLSTIVVGCSKEKANDSQNIPQWLEADSATAIKSRLLSDFSLTFEEGAEKIIAEHPELTIEDVKEFANKHYIEVMEIDGQLRMHKKSPKNLYLLNPDYNGGWKLRGATASEARISYADSVIRWSEGKLADGGAHRVRIRFTIDVPFDSALAGDTLRVWMPYPMETDRQSDVKLLSTYPTDYIVSNLSQSPHSTIYFESPSPSAGDTAHFEYVAEFTAEGAYFSPKKIMADIKPYDKASDLYNKYTAFDNQHIIRLDSLAKEIVGSETNPYKQSELVYDYIIQRYPWAGAREYSTLECIPQYVIDEKHGDCGQVALLYISLMRTLGVPTRWESGWMLHPGEKNLHDWAEIYYEGIGWVPVDVSFGRYTSSNDSSIQKFYSTGIDSHRFIANKAVGAQFYPAKKYVRSETVDAQLGEVECSRGNLFYPAWNQHLEIESSIPISQ